MAFDEWIEGESPATGAVAVYRVVEMLVAAGAVIAADSDGTTYDSDGGQVTTGASGAGGLGNNSAWVRLTFLDGREMTIQRGTSDTAWRVKYSAAEGFTAGSPGATQTPTTTTAGEGVTLLGGGTDASPTYATWFNTNGGYKLFGGANSASPYSWWFGCIPNGGGDPSAGFVFDPVASPDDDDDDPIVFYQGLTGANVFKAVTIGSVSTGTTSSRASGWINYPSGSLVAIPGNFLTSSGGGVLFPGVAGSNPHSGKDNTIPVAWWRGSAQASPYGYKGLSRVLKWNSVTRSSGETFTVSTTRDRISLGDVNLPWSGAVVSL